MFLPPPRWDEEDTREVGKAVVVAAAVALVTKLVEWGMDIVRANLEAGVETGPEPEDKPPEDSSAKSADE